MTTTEIRRVLARGDEIERAIARIAHQMLEPQESQNGLVLLGVRRGGEALAIRLAREIERVSGRAPVLGFLNINLYRDDRVTHEYPSRRSRSTSRGVSSWSSTTCCTLGAPFAPRSTRSSTSGARLRYGSAYSSIAACASCRFSRTTLGGWSRRVRASASRCVSPPKQPIRRDRDPR